MQSQSGSADIQNEEIQILIGTHAILSKNIRFSRLGLVIVDEEHRFGVKQKKKLKRLSQINPLTPSEYLAMSATPIPRTLHMALSGLRRISVMLTPPAGRQSVHTTVMRYHVEKSNIIYNRGYSVEDRFFIFIIQ